MWILCAVIRHPRFLFMWLVSISRIKWLSFFFWYHMSKEKYSDYFDEYPADSWSYSSFIRYVFNKRLLPSNPIRVYNHQYKKCLEVIEQKYSPLTRENSKATLLKNSFKVSNFYMQRSPICWQHNLALSQVNTKQGAHAPPWVSLACCHLLCSY